MKVKESIISGLDVTVQPAIYVQPNAFAQMWTNNNHIRRVSNPRLILEIKDAWQKQVGGEISIQDERVLIDVRHAQQIDPETKQVNTITAQDLLQLDVSQVAIKRAIITLCAQGAHPDFYPTLAIVMTEQGEKYCFGETVRVCNNFTVFDSRYFIDTTKAVKGATQKYTTETAVEYFKRNVFSKTLENFESDYLKIEELTEKQISHKEFLSFMGDQHQMIEYANHARLNGRIKTLDAVSKDLPVNSRQLARIAVESAHPTHPEYQWVNDSTNLWKVINFGTQQIKAERGTDVATLLESNMKWVNLVKSYPFQFS